MALLPDIKNKAVEFYTNYTYSPTQADRANTSRNGPTDFSKSTYDVQNMSYPDDLMSNDERYGGHYVIFYINVSSDSKLITQDKAETVNDYPPRDAGDLEAQKINNTQLVGSNAAVNFGGAVLANTLGIGGGAAPTAAALATVGVGVAASLSPDETRSKKRLKTAIALHIPNQLSIRYGTNYSEEDTAGLSMAAAGGTELMKALDSDNTNSDVKGVGKAIIANLALSKGPMAGANSKVLGLAANPKKEQIFKGVDFRTFAFEYQFFPRDSQEAQKVRQIISQFKYHMHPEFKDTNNFIYIYPSEFDIFYYTNGTENLNLHRHTSCVLTEMNVNYTPNGTFTTFSDGMPTQINITLNFRELALLTKDKIKDGL